MSGQPVAEFPGVVGAVGQEATRDRRALEDGRRADQVVGVSCGQNQSAWTTLIVGQGVDLGRSAAARSPYGVVEGPPFAPAAERCALT